jgi:hypothetical protein
MRPRLYKYFHDRKRAEAFLGGEVSFSSLSFFRDYEDQNVRRDKNEGTSVFKPTDGLLTHNQTQGKPMLLQDCAFEATVKQDEIFVFCTSRSLTDELRDRFRAVVCVEIDNISSFRARVERAVRKKALPTVAKFQAGPVLYYDPSEGPEARWALPDLIAMSKFESYKWQEEFRLVFTLTDAFEFENASFSLVRGEREPAPKRSEYPRCVVKVRTLRDIGRLHEF